MKKIINSIYQILLCFSLLLVVSSISAQDLVIVHVNDTHSHIDPIRSGEYKGQAGVIEQAAQLDKLRAEHGKKNVLFLHAGDFSQGTSYFTELNGDIEIDVLNAMEVDVVCLGNHEFDNGFEELARRLKNLKADVVCANYSFEGTAIEDLVKPYTIVRRGGMKIGIIGLLTDLAPLVELDISRQMEYIHPVNVTNEYAKYLREEKKCDLIIALTHLGFNRDFTDVELAKQIRNVDIIVGGHSHTKLDDIHYEKDLDGENVAIVTSWRWGKILGVLELDK